MYGKVVVGCDMHCSVSVHGLPLWARHNCKHFIAGLTGSYIGIHVELEKQHMLQVHHCINRGGIRSEMLMALLRVFRLGETAYP